jgi:hypothetical protein
MSSLPRPALLAAGLGGLLWTVKALVITANDGSFDPLENVFFIGGLLALLATAVLVAAHLTRRLRLAARVPATIAAALGLVLATLLLESLGKGVLATIATGDNLGLEEEGGILACGLAWLTLAVVAMRRRAATGDRLRPRSALR